jgi:hypothetical protein
MSGTVIIPAVTATPAGAAILADKLAEAIEILRSWKLRVPEASRLPMAVGVLRRVSAAQAYPSDRRELTRIQNAIRIAFDFYHITRTLTVDRVDAVAEDLRRALGGTLDDLGATEALRAQSQVLIAAVMAVGGLGPGAPDPGATKTPDYILKLGTLRFGVEIKRPESVRAIPAKLDEAIDQVAAVDVEGGVIVLDLSDCIPYHSSDGSPEGERELRFSHAREIARHHLLSSRKQGASRITNLLVLANLLGWTVDPAPAPDSILLTYSEVFHTACGGLLVEASREIRAGVMWGLEGFQAVALRHRLVR